MTQFKFFFSEVIKLITKFLTLLIYTFKIEAIQIDWSTKVVMLCLFYSRIYTKKSVYKNREKKIAKINSENKNAKYFNSEPIYTLK